MLLELRERERRLAVTYRHMPGKRHPDGLTAPLTRSNLTQALENGEGAAQERDALTKQTHETWVPFPTWQL